MSVTVEIRSRADVYDQGRNWTVSGGVLTVFDQAEFGIATYAAGEWVDVFRTEERTRSVQTSAQSIGVF